MKIKIRDIDFVVDASFKSHYWEYVNTGLWEPHTFDIIDHCVKENATVFDIGCWAGPLSFYMAGKGASVYAIDPDSKVYESLMNNLKLNPVLSQKIHPFNIAISNKNGPLSLYARREYGDSSTSLLNRTRDQINDAFCEGISLNQFLETTTIKQVDFMKIDIEGGEFNIVDQIVRAKKEYGCTNLLLSLHYDQLNECIYKQKIGNRIISLVLMNLEFFLGMNLFKKGLLDNLKPIISLCKDYAFVYTEKGELLDNSILTPQYLLKNKINLFMTEERWNK